MSQTAMRIGRPLYGGSFACDGGGALPLVLPGELIEGADTVVEASPDRVWPVCVHFGACGGCHYQHADYAAQLQFKRAILRDGLNAAGLSGLPEIAVHPPASEAQPWAYRNRIRLRVRASVGASAAGFEVGYSRPGTNEFLPIRMCPIAAPLLWRAAATITRVATETAGLRAWFSGVSEVEIFCLADESRLQMTFFLREAPRHGSPFDALCERLRQQIPELVGAGAELDPELSRRVRRTWTGAAWGAEGMAYPVAGRSYWVSRGAFFQVNRFLLERLVELACGEAGGGLAWDLFAGVGLFTRVLAERFQRVVAVEAGAAAAADLMAAGKVAAGKASRSGHGFEAVQAPVLEFLRRQELQRDRPELIVLDPPRAGLGVEASEILARIGAARVVYVSCDPLTLARDLAILTRTAYRVESVDLIDLFPQTFHMETVVRLRLRSAVV